MDNTVAILEWESALGVITSATLQPGAGPHRSLEILGSNGTAVVRPIEGPALQIDLVKPAGPYQSKSQQVSLPAYRRYVDDFVELATAIRSRKPLSVSSNQELQFKRLYCAPRKWCRWTILRGVFHAGLRLSREF